MKYIVCSLLILFILSCSDKGTSDTKTTNLVPIYKINLSEQEDIASNEYFNNYFEIVKIIPLLSIDSASKVIEASKIIFYKNQLFILDKKYSSLKVFDLNGNYLRAIGGLGQGEGEYLGITDFLIDNKNGIISIFSNSNRAIFNYSIDGKYLSRLRLDFFGSYIAPFENQNMCFYINFNSSEKNEFNNVIIVNNKGKIDNKFLPYKNPNTPAFDITGYISPNNEGVLASSAFSDTIYQISTLNILPKYVFNFGSFKFNDFEKKDMISIMNELPNHFYLAAGFVETNKLLSFGYIKKLTTGKGYYFKENKKLLITNQFVKNSIINFLNIPTSYAGDTLFSSINGEYLTSLIEKDKNILNDVKKESYGLYEILNKYKEGDNPIVVLYKPK